MVLAASACATSAIVNAARQGDAARVEALLQEGHSGDSRSLDAALLAASLQGHADVVRVVLGHGAQVNARDSRGQSPLYLASWKGHRTAAETLLDGGAEVDAREQNGWTPLMIGSAEGFSNIVEFLLERGANPNLRNVYGRTALHYAAMYGYSNIVERLLTHGADAAIREEESGETPAMVAARFGHNDTAEILRRADATR